MADLSGQNPYEGERSFDVFDQGRRALVLADIVLVVPPDEILLRPAAAAPAAHRTDHLWNQRRREEEWIFRGDSDLEMELELELEVGEVRGSE